MLASHPEVRHLTLLAEFSIVFDNVIGHKLIHNLIRLHLGSFGDLDFKANFESFVFACLFSDAGKEHLRCLYLAVSGKLS